MIDFILLIILCIIAFLGFRKGLIAAILQLVGVAVSFIMVVRFGPLVRDGLIQKFSLNPTIAIVLSYIIIFIFIGILIRLLIFVSQKLLELMQLNIINRILGALFALVNGVIFLLLVYVIMDVLPFVTFTSEIKKKSKIVELLDIASDEVQLKIAEQVEKNRTMNIKYSEKQLEFEKVKELISQECHSSIGAEQALGVSPMHDKKKLVHHLGFIKEIQYLIRIGYNLDFRMLSDLTPLFKNHDEVVFSYLELKQIIDNMIIVESMLGIELEENIEYLSELISGFESCNDLIKRFKQVFDHEGDVLDSASEELRRIRKQKRSTRRNIVKTLDMRIKADSNDLSDSVFTLRDNRYVLPVKDVAAGGFKGVEHGSSSSRSTIFIEPLDIVADNNKLIRLNSDEKQEVFRILKNFSYDVILKKSIIISNCNLLRDLDLKFALGRYANRINGVVPELSDKPEIRLKGARHPLLINSLGSIKKVIPFDIELNDTMKILLISGPNTGGKTVTLKSIGLLTIMTHAGIPIPVDDSSVVGTFDSVFADIGDDQSIEASLSTFSSHIKRIAEMIEFGTEKSLILIDEIGAATDPEQGGALAQAVLERFLEKGMSGVITTHYTSLKLFAEEEKNALTHQCNSTLKAYLLLIALSLDFPETALL